MYTLVSFQCMGNNCTIHHQYSATTSPNDSKQTNFIICVTYHISCSSDGDESNTAAITRDRYCTCYEEPGKQLLILYGTEYGFSEELAKNLFDRFCDSGYQDLSLQPRVLNAKAFEMVDFGREQVLLCVFSTSGDGKPRHKAP